ncbi:uncharacterized protein LOC114304303 isoform X2 [Camellia sinensis]|uniref:uncharacterized protein LOC114304303 isoform X2 n=1 Tax=Camellia sinensis TaxID=4442 RepID=UPI001035CA3D|nr:uncharacterized protein LOC114304303 isoform X2 [Camellia sinensis]
MTTNNEPSSVESAIEILSRSVREKIKAIHQTNYSEDSSLSHPLSFPCIYKVSKELRKLNKRAYNPWVVSIGPIHNNNDDDKEEQHLKEMEHIKVAYTEELLCRIAGKSASPEVKGYWMDKALMECSAAMLHLAASAFNCYADNLKPIIEKKIPQHRLAEMLLIDGCFILELLYSCFRRIFPNNAPKPSHFSHRASDLDCAGVKFEPDTGVDFKEASGLLWWCSPAKFKIPPLSIYDSTEPLLRNLIAFEQCCPSIERRHITSYAFLMDSLIDSAADVELLEKNNIINNCLGASEDASVLFNNICKDVVLEEFDFEKPRNDAESHCRRLWPRFIASLKRDYFSNPWSVIAVVAAFILFALAVVQAVYSLLTYYGVEYGTVGELHDMHSVL